VLLFFVLLVVTHGSAAQRLKELTQQTREGRKAADLPKPKGRAAARVRFPYGPLLQ
jgi:hypothetical protein